MNVKAGEQGALLERPTKELLADFGAAKASPGSGSAAALMGLLAAKLLVTVCDKSQTKEECRASHKVLAYIKQQIEAVEPKLVELFEKDAREFEEVVALRVARDRAKLPKERERCSKQSQELLETATDNAFHIIDICLKLIDHGIVVFRSGWHAVRGDSGAAISAAIAGVMSGIFIANLNLKTLRGRRYASDNIDRCEEVYRELASKQAEAFSCVNSLNAEALASIQLEIEVTKIEADA